MGKTDLFYNLSQSSYQNQLSTILNWSKKKKSIYDR